MSNIAIVSAGPTAKESWLSNDVGFDRIVAINASAVSDWIGPYDVMFARDDTYIKNDMKFRPELLITEPKWVELGSSLFANTESYDWIQPPNIEGHGCWNFTATSCLQWVLERYKPSKVTLFGFDMKIGPALDKSEPYTEFRDTWERPEYERCLSNMRKAGVQICKK